MIKIKENYLVNNNGKPVGIFLDIKEYRKLMKQVEELDAIRAYDNALASKDDRIPFDQAIEEIERKRK